MKRPFENPDRYKKWIDNYLDEILDDQKGYKELRLISRCLDKIRWHVDRELQVRSFKKKNKELPKWVNDTLSQNKNRKKVSKLFWLVRNELWNSALTFDDSKKFSHKYDLERYKRHYLILSIVDIKGIAGNYQVSVDNVRKRLNRWTEKDAPYFKLRHSDNKRLGGKMLYAIGYWIPFKNKDDETGMKKIDFFTKENSKQWLESIYFNF